MGGNFGGPTAAACQTEGKQNRGWETVVKSDKDGLPEFLTQSAPLLVSQQQQKTPADFSAVAEDLSWFLSSSKRP